MSSRCRAIWVLSVHKWLCLSTGDYDCVIKGCQRDLYVQVVELSRARELEEVVVVCWSIEVTNASGIPTVVCKGVWCQIGNSRLKVCRELLGSCLTLSDACLTIRVIDLEGVSCVDWDHIISHIISGPTCLNLEGVSSSCKTRVLCPSKSKLVIKRVLIEYRGALEELVRTCGLLASSTTGSVHARIVKVHGNVDVLLTS